MSRVTLGSLTPEDWQAVRAIYLEGIATGEATFETRAPSWKEWDAAHLSFARVVARRGSDVIGWAALSPVSQRRAYAGVAEVSVYVTTTSRGQGIGRALLRRLIANPSSTVFGRCRRQSFPKMRRRWRCTKAAAFAK